MGKDVIIACDFSGRRETLDFLSLFKDKKPFVKIGMELFYGSGPDIVGELKDKGHKIFLDLKLCDIPNTVKKAMRVLAGLGADMCNLHAFGTKAMMEAALEGLSSGGSVRPVLIAVTQLTSTGALPLKEELLIDRPMDEVVARYAKNALAAGLDGVVCSPLEAPEVHKTCGSGFLTVTPGIRFAAADLGDQVRVTTPEKAKTLGADYIVVGRPITEAKDPAEAYEKCLEGFLK